MEHVSRNVFSAMDRLCASMDARASEGSRGEQPADDHTVCGACATLAVVAFGAVVVAGAGIGLG